MSTTKVEKIIAKGIDFLGQLLPLKTYLYFPLLSSALIWAIRRTEEWKNRILSFQVWLDPAALGTKPDAFVLDFFNGSAELRQAYYREIRDRDIEVLRSAFGKLYPVLGLEDPFLQAIFRPELASGDFRSLVREFEPRLAKAKVEIDAAPEKSRLLEGLKTLAGEILSLDIHLVSEPEIQKMILRELRKRTVKARG
jgi:hypothetical protein